jgi:GDP-mannose 6-dehydrogenase
MYLAKQHDVELPMLAGILPSNRIHIQNALDKVLATGKRRAGIVGLSFKTGTDDLRESPMVTLAEQLIGKGLSLSVYDPEVHLSRLLGANKRFIEQHLPHIGQLIRSDLAEVVQASDVLIVGSIDQEVLARLRGLLRRDHTLIDLAHIPQPETWPCAVEGLCW